MYNKVKSQNGITLIALVITVIILLILAGIGIGELAANDGDIRQTKDTMSLTELNKVQQVVIETYLKYKQLGNESVLLAYGEKISNEKYTEVNNTLHTLSGNDLIVAYNTDVEKSYYILKRNDLTKMGLENINNNDEYIVNYSTGEVFNYTQKKNSNGVLYIYAKNNIDE